MTHVSQPIKSLGSELMKELIAELITFSTVTPAVGYPYGGIAYQLFDKSAPFFIFIICLLALLGN